MSPLSRIINPVPDILPPVAVALILPLFEKEHLACFHILNRTGLSVYICVCELAHLHTKHLVCSLCVRFCVCLVFVVYLHTGWLTRGFWLIMQCHQSSAERNCRCLCAVNPLDPLWSIGWRQIDIGTDWFTVTLHRLFALTKSAHTQTKGRTFCSVCDSILRLQILYSSHSTNDL